MARERDRALKRKFSADVMSALSDANAVEIPKTLVESEVNRMRQQTVQNMMQRGINPENMGLERYQCLPGAGRKTGKARPADGRND